MKTSLEPSTVLWFVMAAAAVDLLQYRPEPMLNPKLGAPLS